MLEQKSSSDNGDMDNNISNGENLKTTVATGTDSNNANENQDGPSHSSQEEESNKDEQKVSKSFLAIVF